ncbi:hypothetical protein SAMN05216480_1107 [Pustulibacterium marinum]|uniref:DUF6268 domain-containing protein n=1 Tax=Pustulibacterium marinum TaxID=1224947 RepID=A0A1I7HLC9_9FLAO|nr:DUF6268 family outer membrane beta-barrel protein [Pustulibacterium marinum]SFU61503.1 hypothetical protein SAMN05216480_1107 [Pustulibacterium marinum]
MKRIVFYITLIYSGIAFAQAPNEIKVEQSLFSGSNVANINKTKAVANFPLLRTNNTSLSIGGNYQLTNFEYVNKDVPFTTSEIENFNTFSGSLQFAQRIAGKWSFVAQGEAQISSNFENDLGSNDYFYNGSLVFRRIDTANQSTWTIGAVYNHQYGLNTPIPVISYAKQVNEKLGYKIGIPETNIHYILGTKHTFSAFAKLDGFMGSFNDDMQVKVSNYEAPGILKQTSVVSGLGYQFRFWKNFSAYVNAGFSVYNNMTIEDYDGNEIYDFDYKNGFYGNIGIQYHFLNKLLD